MKSIQRSRIPPVLEHVLRLRRTCMERPRARRRLEVVTLIAVR